MDDVVALPIGWATVVALFIPILVSFATKYRVSTRAPQALMAFAAAGVVAVLQMLTDDIPNDTVQSILAGFLGVFLPMVAAYLGFWQPVVAPNERLAPSKGV